MFQSERLPITKIARTFKRTRLEREKNIFGMRIGPALFFFWIKYVVIL